MGDAVYISKDDLVGLLKRAYEEGCGGYMDLRDAVAVGIFEEYVARGKAVQEKPLGRFEPYPYNYPERGIRMVTASGHTIMS